MYMLAAEPSYAARCSGWIARTSTSTRASPLRELCHVSLVLRNRVRRVAVGAELGLEVRDGGLELHGLELGLGIARR